jgi:O-antigen ligase
MKDLRSWLLILLGPLVSIAALPGLMIDTTNLIKLLILGIFAGGLSVYLFTKRAWLIDRGLKLVLIPIGMFFIAMFIPLLLSGSPFELQFYGSYGRNTGFLTYFLLILVLLAALVNSTENLMRRIAKGIIYTGTFETAYTFLQYFKIDPIKWNNADGWLFGTFINPNFLSAFLGISCVVIFTFLIDIRTTSFTKLWLIIQLLATLFIILKSQSVQGLAITLVGIAFLIFLFLQKKFKSRLINFGYLGIIFMGSLVSIFGFLQKGPLKQLLYQESISFRGDYWQAGWQIFVHHPLTGVGLDSYGNWYMRYRSLTAATRRGPEVTSTAAHNLFLDFAANGGVLLLLAYVAINIAVLISIVKVFRRSADVGIGFISISVAWVAYLAQSIISINYIALAVWGWLFAGLIIGYELLGSREIIATREAVAKKSTKASKQMRKQSKAGIGVSGLALVLGCLVGAVIALPPFIGDIRWKSALGSGDPTKLIASVEAWPRNSYRFNTTAKGYENNGEVTEALQVSLSSVAYDPRSFDSWRLIYNYPNSSVEQKTLALTKMKELDSNYSSRL